ncbi:MAG TPA: hypothetical protein VD999_00655 [Vitreimonas sp.]|nr:hypothetical protein [Vitreimonas sp.]
MSINHSLKSTAGQTIIEVLIAAGVIALVMTAIAAGLTYSVKNSAESKYKALATSYAQEAVEIFRRERALMGWDTFRNVVGSNTYCLNTLPSSTDEFVNLEPGACADGIPVAGTQMTREAIVTPFNNGTVVDRVRVEIEVQWFDGNRPRTVEIAQEFQQWQ